jgi:hypothetical protein
LEFPLASYERLAFSFVATARDLNPKLELRTLMLEFQSFGPQCSMHIAHVT